LTGGNFSSGIRSQPHLLERIFDGNLSFLIVLFRFAAGSSCCTFICIENLLIEFVEGFNQIR